MYVGISLKTNDAFFYKRNRRVYDNNELSILQRVLTNKVSWFGLSAPIYYLNYVSIDLHFYIILCMNSRI